MKENRKTQLGTKLIVIISMALLGFFAFPLLVPLGVATTPFTEEAWSQARTKKDYPLMMSMTKDLTSKLIGLDSEEVLRILGAPYSKTMDHETMISCYYCVEKPGRCTRGLFIDFKNSKVTSAQVARFAD